MLDGLYAQEFSFSSKDREFVHHGRYVAIISDFLWTRHFIFGFGDGILVLMTL